VHGNTKTGNTPYIRLGKRVLTDNAEHLDTGKRPKDTFDSVFEEAGGMMHASGPHSKMIFIFKSCKVSWIHSYPWVSGISSFQFAAFLESKDWSYLERSVQPLKFFPSSDILDCSRNIKFNLIYTTCRSGVPNLLSQWATKLSTQEGLGPQSYKDREKKQLNLQGNHHSLLMRHLMLFAITKKKSCQYNKNNLKTYSDWSAAAHCYWGNWVKGRM